MNTYQIQINVSSTDRSKWVPLACFDNFLALSLAKSAMNNEILNARSEGLTYQSVAARYRIKTIKGV